MNVVPTLDHRALVMNISDPYLCSILIRGITDQIAVSAAPPKPDATVNQLIQRVTQTSAWAKTIMRKALSEQYADVGWSRSEAQPDNGDISADASPYWVYDPIDGAYHYIQGLPLWSSSLALISEGRTVFSIVYEPSLHELFVATESGGATLNGVPLRVSGKSALRSAVVATALPPFGYGNEDEHRRSVALLGAMSRRVFVVRQMASASLQLAYVAAGRLDAYWETGNDLYDWVAGALLVREAGGQVTDLAGKSLGANANGIAAAPAGLADALLEGLADQNA
ncbi:inositol monophosphatase [Caballeronia mineralivorans]|jgi:myo-inositol-1(or 4)-monophosphatase|uniref:inositol monophosphatase family protein n=1 Tax=Caballeronia mineralivorans TaxID=2010198 RepID=UPI0023F2E72C|nr:inositol monophosphatase [Caballeronia mineralivorans]